VHGAAPRTAAGHAVAYAANVLAIVLHRAEASAARSKLPRELRIGTTLDKARYFSLILAVGFEMVIFQQVLAD
jgi:hypothetical protein